MENLKKWDPCLRMVDQNPDRFKKSMSPQLTKKESHEHSIVLQTCLVMIKAGLPCKKLNGNLKNGIHLFDNSRLTKIQIDLTTGNLGCESEEKSRCLTSPRVRWKVYSNSNNFNDAQMDSDVGSNTNHWFYMLGIIAIHAILVEMNFIIGGLLFYMHLG